MMQLDTEIYVKLQNINWLANCGNESNRNEIKIQVNWVSTYDEALLLAESDKWTDAKTEAQGDLTGYLSKNHYSSYGGYWNKLAKSSRKKIQTEVMPKIEEALNSITGMDKLIPIIMLDLNRIALQQSYKKQFKKVPDFFDKVLKIYEAGYLPCGWDGPLKEWPNGNIICF